MARRRAPEAPSTDDAPPRELVGHALIADWVTPEEWLACQLDDRHHHVTGGHNPWMKASAVAHRKQREARQQWSAERGLVRSYTDWRSTTNGADTAH